MSNGNSMVIAAGTEFNIGGKIVTIVRDTVVSFAGSDTEMGQIGFLKITNAWERNRHLYRGKRDESGRLLPIDDQPDYSSGETLESFLLRIDREDAIYFGGLREWEKAHAAFQGSDVTDTVETNISAEDEQPTDEGDGNKTEDNPPQG